MWALYVCTCTWNHINIQNIFEPTFCLRAATLGSKLSLSHMALFPKEGNSLFFILNRCQCLFVSSFPNAPCFLQRAYFCKYFCKRAMNLRKRAMYPSFLRRRRLLFILSRCQLLFLSSSSHCSFASFFLASVCFMRMTWIGGGWCGWGDYSSDQYCRAVGSSVNKMASVDGPSFHPQENAKEQQVDWIFFGILLGISALMPENAKEYSVNLLRTVIHTNNSPTNKQHSSPINPLFFYIYGTATHCNTLQHTATHCRFALHTLILSSSIYGTATHCNTLQHTATTLPQTNNTPRVLAPPPTRYRRIHNI